MPAENKAPTEQLDPAATAETSANARNGAAKRRDRNEPVSVVGIGASAGGIAPLQQFFEEMKPDSGLAFVVVMHLSPDFESQLASVIQAKTSMPVVQVTEAVKVQPNHVYVIPPNHQLTFEDSMLRLMPPQQAQGRRVTIDLFFRTLAHAYGQRAVSIIMSGTDSDGVIGLKHIRAQGGVTIAQEPEEAAFDSMPLSAIATGMVDWVLRVGDMPRRLLQFVHNEQAMHLPPEIFEAPEADAKVKEAPGGETVSDETRDPEDEEALELVLKHLRAQTGQDFSHYKRATVLRRVARRLQVNSVDSIPRYLEFLRTHPAEARALLHDLLIGVTHFFRDQPSFAALEANIPQLFAGRKEADELRVWVTGCSTGEEAYSIAMLLCEHAEKLKDSPSIQIFATDVDEQSLRDAREGLYPATIEADVSQERLRQFFVRDQGRYRVKKDIRDKVLFARHNVLSDPAFSRIDLVTCRNLLIYLNQEAQGRVFDVFHFALRAGGLLFIGGAESADSSHALFSALDNHHRIYIRRSIPRPTWSIPALPRRFSAPDKGRGRIVRPMLPGMKPGAVEGAGEHNQTTNFEGQERRSVMFGELHLKLLEEYGPPSVVVNEAHDIVHLSENAGRYLTFRAGEPSTNLMTVVNPALRVELRTALFRAGQSNESVIIPAQSVPVEGTTETINLHVRPIRPGNSAQGFFLILFEKKTEPLTAAEQTVERETISRDVGDELQSLKQQLNATVEQFEVSSEELQASNEELQAMNEELRSAAEELETSKEELQSVNEELITVNHELKEKVEDLSRANSDLNNLMTSTDLATIFLDRQLRVVRFTPRVQDTFNLLAADVGRPISDITHKLRYETLIADAERVLDRLASIEREIATEDERCFLARISPYRTIDDKISGVVVTLIDVTQIKHAQAEVRAISDQMAAREHRFETIMKAVPDFVYEFDLEGRFTFVNPSLLALWGLTAEEAIGKNFHQLDYTPELATKLQRQIQEVIETRESLQDETPYTSHIGERMYEYLFSPLFGDDGKVEAVAGVTRDITDRRRAESALRASEERFRNVADNVPQVIWTNDVNGTADYFNKRWFDYSGLSHEESYGPGWQAIVHPDDAPVSVERWQRAFEKGEVFDAEYRLRGADGEYRWFIGRNVPLRTDGKVLSWFGSATDINDFKQAQAALRESDERFRQFAENSADTLWMINAQTRQLDYLSPAYEKMWGESRDPVMQALARWEELLHPEDREQVLATVDRLLAGETLLRDYRIVRPDGSLCWIRDVGFPIYGANGQVERIAGIAQDITGEKKRTKALEAAEERFRLLVEGAPDYAMFLLNTENVITYWSAGAEKIFGWTAEEAVGKTGALIFTPEDRERGAVEEEIGTACQQGFAPDRRWHLRKDGSRLWVDGVMRRLDYAEGGHRGFAKIAQDATDIWKAEEQLRQAHDELEQRVRHRTRELEAMNETLAAEMAHRQTLERQILEVTERERARISQDLHDSLCQELTATAFFLKSQARKIQDGESEQALVEASETVNRNAGLARDLARGLHPLELGSGGLLTALKELCARTSEKISSTCDLPRSLKLPNEGIALNLYRIAQEAVTNAAKHARAGEIRISVEVEKKEVILRVEDDGQGMKKPASTKGLGIHMMTYRANVSGGTLQIESRRGRGTIVTCRVPRTK